MTDTFIHPAPRRSEAGFGVLLVGAAAAPIFWLGQTMLAFWVTSLACYGSDHPTTISPQSLLRATLLTFDAIAFGAVLAGGFVSAWCWNRTRKEMAGGATHAIEAGEGRARFLALWGLLSSLCFFGAVLFNVIASVIAPLCMH